MLYIANGLPTALLPLLQQKPHSLAVSFQDHRVQLQTSSFNHVDPRVKHESTRWEIRTEEGEYDRNMALDILTGNPHLTVLSISLHRLQPDTRYRWRVSFISSAGQKVTSDEQTFNTPIYDQKLKRFDLVPHFNRDVVVNLGDDSNDTVDGFAAFLVDDFVGANVTKPNIRSLPHQDGKVGIHQLGDYSSDNVLQLVEGQEEEPITVAAGEERYSAIRFLITGGGGDSDVPLRFVYTDGTTDEHVLLCEDWGHDMEQPGLAGSIRPNIVPVLNNLNQSGLGGGGEAALFEVSLDVNPRKKLKSIVLEAGKMKGEGGTQPTRFNLFAATGVWGTAETKNTE